MIKKINIDNLICIGSIGKPKGLSGEFFLNSYSYPKENILNYSNFIFENDSVIDFNVSYVKKINSKFVAKIKQINNREDIKKYTNVLIYIPKADLPELDDNNFYWHELIGMTIVNKTKNENLGIVDDIANFGSNDCLVVKCTSESIDNQNRLIPFVRDIYIKEIVSKEMLILVDWEKNY